MTRTIRLADGSRLTPTSHDLYRWSANECSVRYVLDTGEVIDADTCDVLARVAVEAGKGTPGKAPRAAATTSETGNRFGIINGFVDVSMHRLHGTAVKVWLVLWRDTRNGTARAGLGDIARRAGVNVRSARRAIHSLAAAGVLRVVRRGGIGRGPNVYTVSGLPDPQQDGTKRTPVAHD